jgi:two-component system phosphate regulon sensor histidine kinase PhoR
MRFSGRLVLGTFTVVLLTVVVLVWGTSEGIPGVVLIALAVALVLAWIAGRSIARPLVALSEAARDIAAGAVPRFPRSGIPEVDTLVEALRRMHRELADRQVELLQQKAGAGAIVNAMVEGVIASDRRGRIVTANPAARMLLGYAADSPMPDLPSLFRDKVARDAIDRVLAGEAVNNCEVDLDERVVALNARPLGSNGAVVVLHDLTAIRRLEAVRRDFVANVSHELKTPLTSIAGYADTLLDPAIDPATQRQFLETIVANAQRMQLLIDDLLDLSRIEAGRWTPRLKDVDLARAIEEAWEPFRERARARSVEFAVHLDGGATTLVLDSDALRQVLTNLFDNAVRYAPPGGHINCRTDPADGGVAITVEDDGSGIPSDHLSRIFERFYRVDPARSRDAGGTGLGLSIVRHLVEAHGGQVSATSELQRGTAVRCWFPRVPAGATDSA